MLEFISIPEERLKILKREKKLKEQIEKLSETKIELNEEVSIESEDSIKLLRVKEVIKAFGRGFDLEDALNLLDEEFHLETMDIKLYAGKSRDRLIDLKGRVIGTKGKTKKLIERHTNTKIAIYGKTIIIIGKWEDVNKTKEAIEMILSGSKHSSVYRFLEEQVI